MACYGCEILSRRRAIATAHRESSRGQGASQANSRASCSFCTSVFCHLLLLKKSGLRDLAWARAYMRSPLGSTALRTPRSALSLLDSRAVHLSP
eukprot:3969964-Pleurochrysis_carterae.AAC.3